MGLKKFKPTTPGQRHKIVNDYAEITTNSPEKSLLAPIKKSGGRNSSGKMTMRYLGGGHKKRYRVIDFKREKFGIPGIVKSVEYDPNRSAFISLINYKDGEKRYIIAPKGIKVGQEVVSGEGSQPEVGNTLFLKDIPLGTVVHNVELRPGQGAKLVRSAGAWAQLIAKEGKFAILRLPSKEVRMILLTCMASIGAVSNSENALQVSGKAGRSRWLGRRPRVRGCVMNPVDHPMGGGEGKSAGGQPRSRTGVLSKGYKTRYPKKDTNRYIIERRKK